MTAPNAREWYALDLMFLKGAQDWLLVARRMAAITLGMAYGTAFAIWLWVMLP